MRRIPRTTVVALLAGTCALGVSSSARADEARTNAPLAEALFRDGRELMTAHRLAEACPKLAESQRLDPRIGTLLNVATCHELEGRTATAWAELTEAQRQAQRLNRPDYERFAREHLQGLEARLARLRIASAERPAGLSVQLDGKAIGAEALDTSFPIDPGEHTVTAAAPGRAPWTGHVHVEAASAAALIGLTIPALGPAEPASEPSPRPIAPETPPATPSSPSDPRRTVGLVALGVGAVGLGVGAYFGVRTFGKKSDGEALCNGAACSQAGLDAQSEAHAFALVSTVAFGVGLAATAVGLYALLTGAPTSTEPRARITLTPHASLGSSGLSLRGLW